MRLINADKFLEYLIFSKHIDSLKCEEVKEAVKMCEVNAAVCDIEQIRSEIITEIEDICAQEIDIDPKWTAGLRYSLQIIDKYMN